MKHWKSGSFERERLSTLFRAFAPAHAVESLDSIDLDQLWNQGKRLILLDVDNTIVAWKQEDFKPSVLGWIARAKELGFDICILSNTRRLTRLARIRTLLGVETVRGRFKPSRAMYRLALLKFSRRREEAVMIGDQMMTDILGANRAGIDAIWVRRMEDREFAPTAINRFIERLLTSAIYKALILTEDQQIRGAKGDAPRKVALIEQVVRFLVVGGVSFAIDFVLTSLLMEWKGVSLGGWLQQNLHLLFAGFATPDKAAAPVLGGMASFVAMFNSFVWNRTWTFEARGKDSRAAQMGRFYAVSILGACFNAGLFTCFYSVLVGKQVFLSKAFAAAIVAIWNFFGQRYFAFKPRQT